jgi:carboxylesterase
MATDPGPETGPFELDGDHVGVLLLHGFTGTPLEMRALGDALAARGRTVFAPRLPGHGTTVENLGEVAYEEWIEAGLDGFDRLASRCDEVIVCGLSMGSLVGAKVCAQKPASGLVAMAPALGLQGPPIWLAGLLKPFIKSIAAMPERAGTYATEGLAPQWSYDRFPLAGVHELAKLRREAERVLPEVTCPLLVLLGRHDQAVTEAGARKYLSLVDTGDKELIWLENSGHVVPVDGERELVFARVAEFIDAHSAG